MKNLSNYNHYIKGSMSESEMDDFTSKLLKEHLGDQERAERWSKLLAQQEASAENTEASPAPRKSMRVIYLRVASIAAALLLLVLVAPNLRTMFGSSAGSLVSEHLENPFPYYSSRTVDANTPDMRLQANSYYHEQNYQEAIAAFLQIIQQGEASIYDHFYLGLSYLYTGQFSGALEHLQLVKNHEDPTLINEANWFLSLSYLNAGNQDAARSLLEAIVANKQWKHKEARELLQTMD